MPYPSYHTAVTAETIAATCTYGEAHPTEHVHCQSHLDRLKCTSLGLFRTNYLSSSIPPEKKQP